MYGRANNVRCRVCMKLRKPWERCTPPAQLGGSAPESGVWGSEPTYTCLMHNPLCAKGIFIYYISQFNVHDSRNGCTIISPYCS